MRTKFWIAINAIAIAVYICLASRNWDQEDVPIILRDDANVIRWLEFCLPLLAVATIFNVVCLFFILRRIRHTKSWKPLISWTLIAASWTSAFKYDRYRFTWESPLGQQKEDEIERDWAAADESARETAKRSEAAGISPYRIDSAGARYYHSLSGTNSSTSGSSNQNLLEHAENPK